jgi:hypothetical protein
VAYRTHSGQGGPHGSSAWDKYFFRQKSKGCKNGVRICDLMVIRSPYHWTTAWVLLLCELVCLCIIFLGADSVQSAWKRESNIPRVRSHCSEMSQTHLSVVVALKVIRPTYQVPLLRNESDPPVSSSWVEHATCQVPLLRNESDPPVSSSCTESNWTHLTVLVALKLIFFKEKY